MSSPAADPTAQKASESRPAVFLSLAPTTSDSYPQSPKSQETKRRSSSLSSDGLRFLKLGPVHYGEHPGENQDDWHAVLN